MKLYSLSILFFVTISSNLLALKVLHVTLHEGCKMDFEEVGRELGIEVTSYFVQEKVRNNPTFWDGTQAGNEIYNVGPQRAKRVWDRHKDFFNTFDVIVTSDTAPLSRIFLQNGWTKPLIIWVCNRFDYAHGNGGEDRFPDRGYYDMIRAATKMNNVRIVSYTPYENVYAQRKGIDFGPRMIKPLGRKTEHEESFVSKIPAEVIKKSTLFLYPRLDDNQAAYIKRECQNREISVYSGVYNGPQDLADFKGVIYFPYQWSNLAFFEGVQRGLIHFVPSEKFVQTHSHAIRYTTLNEFHLCEWYMTENRPCIVYFDSWDDLKQKVASVNYEEMRKHNIEFGITHRATMLKRWKDVFQEFGITI